MTLQENMHHQLWFTALLNKYLGAPTAALLSRLGIHSDPHFAFNNVVAMEILVALLLLVFFVLVRMRLSVENPGGIQNIAEMLEGFINNQSRDVIGPHSEKFTPFLATMGVFILVSNLIGLVPGFESPTAAPVVPLGCALLTFVYYHFHGIREVGIIRYILHFLGPQDPTMPLALRVGMSGMLFPIEIFSHLARIMSLTIRLYANMFAGDMVTLAFFSLIPLLVPVAFLFLHLGVAMIQTYIFVLLATAYLSGAVAEAH
jgi:F-type H+-transporting ATPase subunit a